MTRPPVDRNPDHRKGVLINPTLPPMPPSLIGTPVADQILDAVRLGMPLGSAADYVGISRNTLWRWIRLGMMEDAKEEYRTFFLAVQKASAEGRMELLKMIWASAQKRPESAQWLLEHMDPFNFGKSDAMRTNYGHLTDRELLERAAEIGLAVEKKSIESPPDDNSIDLEDDDLT